MEISTLILTILVALCAGLAVGVLTGVRLGAGVRQREQDGAADQVSATLQATSAVVAPVKDSLDRFDDRLRELESSGVAWQERLAAQVESVRLTGEGLRRETLSLATALRRPQVRGQWGEMHLRRAVELAGMVQHCDFTLQTSTRTADGMQRPDMLVRLAGGRHVVVDAKVPLEAFLRATDAAADGADDSHSQQLTQHARQVRQHIDALAAKAYWRQFAPAPEFVVMFVPGDAFLSHALDADPTLLEYAATRKVVPATPTTLIALLRTVSYAWTQESLADNAREVHDVACELYERLGILGAHVDKVGRSLTAAVGAYNSAVGALEGRVLVSARRLHHLHVGDDEIAPSTPVEQVARPLSAPELVAHLDRTASSGDDRDAGSLPPTGDVTARRTG
ncbi:DNA recombination protein RmuC [soil metagenome]